MGEHGPIPKRSEERRRRNTTDSEGAPNETEKVVVADGPAEPLPITEHWHDYAKEFYQACIDSAQSRFYEPSDWAALKMACEVQSRLLKPAPMKMTNAEGDEYIEWVVQPIKGADLSALNKVWSSLMVTEGDRRRLRLEIERGADKPREAVTVDQVTQNRAGLFSVPGGRA